MLDLRSKAVLKFLVEQSKEGSYKVVDVEDIISCIPKQFRADKEVVGQILKHLQSGDYISVKYGDDEKYCLCPLPFGRQFMENEEISKNNQQNFKKISIKQSIFSILIW